MPKYFIALSTAVTLGFTVTANEPPTEPYRKAMRDNAAAMQSVRVAAKELEESGAGAQDYQPFESAAGVLTGSLATTLAFWESKKVDGAIALAKEGAAHVANLEKAAKDRNYTDVLDAIMALEKTCTACHTAHRVRLDDGSFEIK